MYWFVAPRNLSRGTKRKRQRCEERWVLKMHLEAHFDFTQKQNFWLMQPLCWAPDEIFGKCINDMPMYLNLPNCFLTFLKSASLDLELCFQTSKSPQIWMGHFLLRNTYQPVAYYWLDGSLHWQWHRTRTPAFPACRDHGQPALLSFFSSWRAICNFQDSFLQNLFKMSASWQR